MQLMTLTVLTGGYSASVYSRQLKPVRLEAPAGPAGGTEENCRTRVKGVTATLQNMTSSFLVVIGKGRCDLYRHRDRGNSRSSREAMMLLTTASSRVFAQWAPCGVPGHGSDSHAWAIFTDWTMKGPLGRMT